MENIYIDNKKKLHHNIVAMIHNGEEDKHV